VSKLNEHISQYPVKAVILAGGSGTRLWPLSRTQLPKQFLRLQGEKTLLDATVHRLAPLIEEKDVLIVTGSEHAKGEAYNSLQHYQTLLEPTGRNTAPAIALAAAWLLYQSRQSQQSGEAEDPIMVVLPADHIIKEREAFQSSLKQAIEVAKQGSLVTFGIKPTRPDTGFGYIKANKPSSADNRWSEEQLATENSNSPTLDVIKFTEKPDEATANRYFQTENYYWNSGMFVWRASAILEEIKIHLPELHRHLSVISSQWMEEGLPAENCEFSVGDWEKMPNISIDYGVLEKSKKVTLVPCNIGWSDVGSWDAVHEIALHDSSDNALQGRVIAKDCKNSLIHSNKRLVAAVGVEDLCVVETQDALLITKRGDSQRVREVVELLKQDKGAQEHLFHCTVNRPWGSYTVLEEHTGFKMKRITVNPSASLSLQRHQHRSEHWVVVSGTATVTLNEQTQTITKNQSTYIPIGMKHRLENLGKIPLEIIEVQVGEYLGEDDIERLGDTYGREE